MVVTGLSTSVEPGSLPRCALLLRTSLVLQVSKAWQLEPFCCINALAASLQTRRGAEDVYWFTPWMSVVPTANSTTVWLIEAKLHMPVLKRAALIVSAGSFRHSAQAIPGACVGPPGKSTN